MKKRALSLLLSLVLLLGLLPTAAMAQGEPVPAEMVTVTLDIDISSLATAAVLAAKGLSVPLASPIQVTVPAGSTVKDVLIQASEVRSDLSFIGIDTNFITGINWVTDIAGINTAMDTTVSADSFSLPGWSYSINGDTTLVRGITSDIVTADATYRFFYSLQGVWDSSAGAMRYYDHALFTALDTARETIADAGALNTDTFTPVQIAFLNEKSTALGTLADGIETEADGLWLTYFAKKASSLYAGDSAVLNQLSTATELLTHAMNGETANPNELTSLKIGDGMTTSDSEIIPLTPDFSSSTAEYVIRDFQNTDFTFAQKTVKFKAVSATSVATISVVRDGIESTRQTLTSGSASWLAFTALDWTVTHHTFAITVTPPVGSAFPEKVYTLTVYRPLTAAEQATEQAAEIADNIAARLIREGVPFGSNAPWFMANLATYAAQNPTKPTLTDKQRQDYISYAIGAITSDSSAGDLAKYSLSLKALGVDPTNLTAIGGAKLNLIERLAAMIDNEADEASNNGIYYIYHLPYALIALQQDAGYITEEQTKKLIDSALRQNLGQGAYGFDAVPPVMLALAPYYATNEQVKTALDAVATPEVIAAYQGDTGAMYNYGAPNANSTGLVLMGLAALGKDATLYAKNGKTLLDGLMALTNDAKDAFLYSGTVNSAATEQGLRGLLSLLGYQTTSSAYRLYDFSSTDVVPGVASWINSPVTITAIPNDATIVVKAGRTTQPALAPGLYDLAAGDYTYTVTKAGHHTKPGSFTVTAQEAASHTPKDIHVSLIPIPPVTADNITVTVYVKTHNEDTCNNTYTYKHNGSAYSDLARTPVILTLPTGSSVFSALNAALTPKGIAYQEKSAGYIDSIAGISELDHGSKSGWMYRVGSTTPDIGCRDYTLTSNSTVTWFYTDDYPNEYGAEQFPSGGSTKPEEKPPANGKVEVTPPATTDKNGEAKATVTAKEVTTAIAQAKESKAGGLVITPEIKGTASKVSVALPGASLAALSKESGMSLTMGTPVGSLTLSAAGLAALAKEDGKTITLSADRSIDGSVTITVAADGKAMGTIAGGLKVSIPVPDTLKVPLAGGRVTPQLVAALVAEDGTTTLLPKSLVIDDVTHALLTGSATVTVVNRATGFTDVPASHWAAGAVSFAAGRGLLQSGGDTFAPDQHMTRAMLVTVLHRLENSTEAGEAKFTDVPATAFYAKAVSWAEGQGIVAGSGGAFTPEGDMTREQLATFLFRYAKTVGLDTAHQGADLSKFSDSSQVSAWATEGMSWAVSAGLLTGKGDGTLAPAAPATRGEVAALMERVIALLVT